jgi:signal transduction histidine kinase
MLRLLECHLTLSNLKASIVGPIKETLQTIGGHYAFTWPVAAISFLWAAFISVAFDGTRFGTSKLGWFFAATVAQLTLIAIGILVQKKLLPARPRPSKPALTLFIFACFGFIRSVIIGQLAVLMELAPSHEWGYRQISGVITVTTGLSATTILATEIAKRKDALKELIEERSQLITLQQNSESLFNERLAEIHEIIDDSIRPSLDEINQAITVNTQLSSESTEQTTKLIANLIDQRLRPLSDALHESDALSTLEKLSSRSRKPIVKLSTKVELQKLISPALVFSAMTSITVSASIYYAGFTGIPLALFINLPFLIMLTLVKKLINVNLKLNIWVALPISAILHLGSAFPGLYIVKLLDKYYLGLGQQFIVGLIGFTGSSILIGLFRAAESERLNYEIEFKEANDEASALLGNLNQRIWLARKNAAQLLHGSVQASLTSANLRLRQDNLTADTLQRVRDDIARAISSLSNLDRTEIDLEESLEELIDLWDGVCNIDVEISPDTVLEVNKNVAAAYCANEFIKECVNNAIKHGMATQIDIKIWLSALGDLELEIVNDGLNNPASEAGLGTRILDEITIDWDRSAVSAGTRVWGRIALAPNLVN